MENDGDKVASSKQRTERFAMPPVTSVTCSVALALTASEKAPLDSPIKRRVVMHGPPNEPLQGRRTIYTTLVELLETKCRMRQIFLPCLRLPHFRMVRHQTGLSFGSSKSFRQRIPDVTRAQLAVCSLANSLRD
jgi:hypothetical protein